MLVSYIDYLSLINPKLPYFVSEVVLQIYNADQALPGGVVVDMQQ